MTNCQSSNMVHYYLLLYNYTYHLLIEDCHKYLKLQELLDVNFILSLCLCQEMFYNCIFPLQKQ